MRILIAEEAPLVDREVRADALEHGPHFLEYALVRADDERRFTPQDQLHAAERAGLVYDVLVRVLDLGGASLRVAEELRPELLD